MNIITLINNLNMVVDVYGEELEVQNFSGELNVLDFYDEEVATINL